MSITVTELSGWIVAYLVTVAGERFVNRVIDNLVDEVMKPAFTGRTDVHAGPLANRLKAL